MGILVKKLTDGKKQGSKMALHEAVSNQHHPAIHTFQSGFFWGGGLRRRPFQQVQKKSEAGNLWTITRETLQ